MSQQTFYSERQVNTLDEKSRLIKAEKILAVLRDYAGEGLETWRCLDVGCSGGITSRCASKVFRHVIGIDVDVKALAFARQNSRRANSAFVWGSGCTLPFEDGQFDVVICNHVYEHVPDTRALFDEIYRVLSYGGVCYLACTNKYWVMEPHYRLPLLSWLPRPLSNTYLQLTGRGSIYLERLLSRKQILKLLHRFHVTEYTMRIFESPRQFYADDVVRQWAFARYIPTSVARRLTFWMPNFVWVLKKARPS
jgi:ubiquinone/menaquinone biosynthesis C-methylase UbiE